MTKAHKRGPLGAATPKGPMESEVLLQIHVKGTSTDSTSQGFDVLLVPDGLTIKVPAGRLAQTMRLLLQCGEDGFTSGDASPLGWARRTSGYIHDLRKLGIPIETRWESLSDGVRIGRYLLAAQVEVQHAE